VSHLVPRDELRHAVEARRELGPDYEDQIADALAEKIERRLTEKIERRLTERSPARHQRSITPLVLGSLGIAIPLMSIAGNFAGLAGIIAVCTAIVLVNWIVASETRRSASHRRR
jgi:hypothetical protein